MTTRNNIDIEEVQKKFKDLNERVAALEFSCQ